MSTFFAEASLFSLFALGIVVAIAAVVVGASSNAILRETGFGTVGNAIILTVGAGSGVWTGLAFFEKL